MDDQNDNLPAELHSDGELSEDSLFEWDGEEWVPVEHDPFYGFDEPQEWIEPPRQIYPPPRRTRNVEPEAPTHPVTSEPRIDIHKVVAGLIVGVVVCLFFFVIRDSDEKSLSYSGATFTARPSPTSIVATATPSPAMFYADCDVPIPYPAYILTVWNAIIAIASDGSIEPCLWKTVDEGMIYPQMSADGQETYIMRFGRVLVYDAGSSEIRYLENLSGIPLYHFDLSPDDTRVVYERNGMLHIYDLQTGNTTDFSPPPELRLYLSYPVWSPDGRDIYFASRSQIARVSADWTDYQVIYEDESPTVTYRDLAVSDDGERIAAVHSSSVSRRATELLVLDNATGDVRRIITGGHNTLGSPQWSADGEHIVIIEIPDDAEYPLIAIYDMDGAMTTPINSQEPAMNAMTSFDLWYGTEE